MDEPPCIDSDGHSFFGPTAQYCRRCYWVKPNAKRTPVNRKSAAKQGWERIEWLGQLSVKETAKYPPDLLPQAEWVAALSGSHYFLLLQQGPWCAYCGAEFSDDLPPTLDHVIPRCKGGTRDKENALLACKPCNGAKGDLDLVEFLRSRHLPKEMT